VLAPGERPDELGPIEFQEPECGSSPDGRCALDAVKERDLAERLAGAESAEEMSPGEYLGRSRLDHVEGSGVSIAFTNDFVLGSDSSWPKGRSHRLQLDHP
jgi:hypothetical protein